MLGPFNMPASGGINPSILASLMGGNGATPAGSPMQNAAPVLPSLAAAGGRMGGGMMASPMMMGGGGINQPGAQQSQANPMASMMPLLSLMQKQPGGDPNVNNGNNSPLMNWLRQIGLLNNSYTGQLPVGMSPSSGGMGGAGMGLPPGV